jgi:hypothetical protein
MARAGMSNLIRRLRGMTAAGTADATINSTTWWSDDHIQEMLDHYRTELNDYPLEPRSEYSSAGSLVYMDYIVRFGDLEEAASGTTYWSVITAQGTAWGTASYTVDYLAGLIRFNADTAGSVFYLRARSYNLNRAAAEIWNYKAAHTAEFYSFSTDSQSFTRSQWFDHCISMADRFDRKKGVQSSRMVRTDLL